MQGRGCKAKTEVSTAELLWPVSAYVWLFTGHKEDMNLKWLHQCDGQSKQGVTRRVYTLKPIELKMSTNQVQYWKEMVLVIEMEGLNRGIFGDDGDLNAYSIHVSARSSVLSSTRQRER